MKRIHLLYVIVVCIVLTPWMPISEGLPEMRPEWFVVLLGLVVFPISPKAIMSTISAWCWFVIVSGLISTSYGTLFLGIDVIYRDFFTVIYPVVFMMFFLLARSGIYSIIEFHKFLKVSLIALGISAVITVIQFFDPNIVFPIINLWDPDERSRLYTLRQATGTMGNPNDQGFLMIIGFSLALFTIRHKITTFPIRWGVLALFFVATFLTGSRTAMVCVSVVIAFFLLIEMQHNIASVVIATIIMAGLFLSFNEFVQHSVVMEGLLDRMTSFQRLDTDNAWRGRVQMALYTLDLIGESWIFGHGPAKEAFDLGGNVDNEYVLTLYRFGVLGLVATAGFTCALALQLSKPKATCSPLLLSMRHFSIASVVAAALFAYTAGIFMSFRLFGLLLVLWTVAARVFFSAEDKIAVKLEPRIISAPFRARDCHGVD